MIELDNLGAAAQKDVFLLTCACGGSPIDAQYCPKCGRQNRLLPSHRFACSYIELLLLLNGHQATFFLPRLSVVDGSNNAGINYVGGLTRRIDSSGGRVAASRGSGVATLPCRWL